MYMFARGIDLDSVSTNLRLDFGNESKRWQWDWPMGGSLCCHMRTFG